MYFNESKKKLYFINYYFKKFKEKVIYFINYCCMRHFSQGINHGYSQLNFINIQN